MAAGNESFEPASELEELKRALAEQTRRAQDREAEIARLRTAYCAAVRSLCERHWTLLAANRKPRLLGPRRRNARQEDMIASSILFDPEWYAARYLDATESDLSLAQHYCRIGARKGYAPGPAFSGRRYEEQYPDVAQAATSSLGHFEMHGRAEGRGISPLEFGETIVFRPPPAPLSGLLTRTRDVLVSRYREAPDQILYREWVEKFDTLTDRDRCDIEAHIRRLDQKPRFSILLSARAATRARLRMVIQTIRRQIYSDWELLIVADPSTPRLILRWLEGYKRVDRRIIAVQCAPNIAAAATRALQLATGPFVALLGSDILLAEQALYEVAVEVNERPNAHLIYSDQDSVDRKGRRSNPFLKTDWNPELFLAFDTINPLGVFRRSLMDAVGGFREEYAELHDYDLALRASGAAPQGTIRHIPAILCHCLLPNGHSVPERAGIRDVRLRAKNEILNRSGDPGKAVAHPLFPQWDVIERSPPDPPPLVSVIVPTRNRADLLGACVAGVLERTLYPSIELIVVDHESRETATIGLLDRLREHPNVRILEYFGPFNFSDMNNRAVAAAKGDLLCFLNNDVEVIEPEWLSEMAALAVLPANGAIGAKLLYPDGKLQHGGVLVGIGAGADHLHRYAGGDDPGYFGRLALATNVSAVTAACLVLRKELFFRVGGYDAEHLKVTFNDVDLCLKIQEAGYRNVWTPRALLWHHECASRGSDVAPENHDRFWSESRWLTGKWAAVMGNDPFLNPNFSDRSLHFKPAFPPRRQKPWRTAI